MIRSVSSFSVPSRRHLLGALCVAGAMHSDLTRLANCAGITTSVRADNAQSTPYSTLVEPTTSVSGLTSTAFASVQSRGLSGSARAALAHDAAAAEAALKRVLVPVADGTEEIEAVTIIDVLVRAGAKVTVASVTPRLEVVCSRGVKIVAETRIEECAGRIYDLVACPGGMPGAKALADSAGLTQLLLAQHKSRRLVGAICASPGVVLAPLGILKNKRAAVYPADAFKALLTEHGALLATPEEAVVVDGDVITSRGPATAMEFALVLVEKLFGPKKMHDISQQLLFKK